MKFLAVFILLLAVINAITAREIGAEHRQQPKDENIAEVVKQTVNSKFNETNDEQQDEKQNVSVEDEENEAAATMEEPLKESTENDAVTVNNADTDKGKVFTLSNHQLHDLHWELFSQKETTTTRRPTHHPTYPTYPTTTTRRPITPTPTHPHHHHPYPPYPPYPSHPHYPHRPPYPPYYGAPPPPFGYPPFGFPPIPWWLLRPPRPTRQPPTEPAPAGSISSGPGTSTNINRRKPQRRRPTTPKPFRDTAYKDYIQSLKPLADAPPPPPPPVAPIYLAVGEHQPPFGSTNFIYNPALNQLIPLTATSKPLYVQTSVSTSPDSNVLSLSTSLSSSSPQSHHQTAPVSTTANIAAMASRPANPSAATTPEAQLTRIGNTTSMDEAAAVADSTTSSATSTSTQSSTTPSSGNETFCAMFSWICESNSKVKVAQFENPNKPSTPYVVLLVQPPPPTQITFMKSAE